MELNGMAWVGNIYQKFEALCLEVEENMYQDTVKYVENQVQTVGSTVKKFYSNVLQDISPSSIDPTKEETFGASVKKLHLDDTGYVPPSTTDFLEAKVPDSSREKHANTVVYKKPRQDIKEEPIKDDIKQSAQVSNTVIDGVKDLGDPIFLPEVCCLRSQSSLSSVSSVQSVERESVSNTVQHNDGGHCKSNLRMKENSPYEENFPYEKNSSQTSGVPKPMEKELEFKQCILEERKNCSETASTSECIADFPPSERISLVEFGGEKEMEMRLSSGGNTLAEPNAMNDSVVYVTAPFLDVTRSFKCVEVSTSDTGSLEGRTVDGINVVVDVDIEPEIVTVESLDGVKLKEGCVMVDTGKSCFVSQKEVKRRSYKKKIRDVFSTKIKSARKQEYKQLALQFGVTELNQSGTLNPNFTMEQPQRLKTVTSSESEWEVVMPL